MGFDAPAPLVVEVVEVPSEETCMTSWSGCASNKRAAATLSTCVGVMCVGVDVWVDVWVGRWGGGEGGRRETG